MTGDERTGRRIGYAATVFGVLGFSAKAIFTKLAYPYGVDPITLMALRSLVAVPVLWLLLLISREPGAPLGRRGWLRMAWAGFASYYLASFLDFYGLQTVTAILERILLFLYPCFVVLLGAAFSRRRLRASTWLAMALAYGGVVVTLAAGGREQFQGDWLGLGLILAAALIFATYYLTAGDLVRRLATVRFSAYLMSIAGGATLAHFLATRPVHLLLDQPWPVYAHAVGLGLVSTVLPILMIAEGLRRIDTDSSAAINLLGPVFTVGMAYAFLGESMRPWQWLGFVVALAGVFLLGRSFRPGRGTADR